MGPYKDKLKELASSGYVILEKYNNKKRKYIILRREVLSLVTIIRM
jgi:hypothetical protein